MPNQNTPKALETAWVDERELAFNTEIHHLLDAASDAIDTEGALESVNATLPIVEKIREKLLAERARRTGEAFSIELPRPVVEALRAQMYALFQAHGAIWCARRALEASYGETGDAEVIANALAGAAKQVERAALAIDDDELAAEAERIAERDARLSGP